MSKTYQPGHVVFAVVLVSILFGTVILPGIIRQSRRDMAGIQFCAQLKNKSPAERFDLCKAQASNSNFSCSIEFEDQGGIPHNVFRIRGSDQTKICKVF
jgi:hypothetical protein